MSHFRGDKTLLTGYNSIFLAVVKYASMDS